MSMIETTDIERRIAGKIDQTITGSMALATNRTGGLVFANMGQVMEFAKAMAISDIGVRRHLRGRVGACLAVTVQAIEWEMSPFAVASKSYEVNNVIAYEAQLINAVILRRAPIIGRFHPEYSGEGDNRALRVWVRLRDENEIVDYTSPLFGRIQPKNSPLWKNDPDQQLFYFSSRALCRRHFPDVLLGVYSVDDMLDSEPPPVPRARNMEMKSLGARLDALAADPPHDPETGEIIDHEQDSPAPGAATEPAGRDSSPAAEAADMPLEGAASASSPRAGAAPTEQPADREARKAEIRRDGDARAAAGTAALASYLNELRKAGEADLVSTILREQWREVALAADAKKERK